MLCGRIILFVLQSFFHYCTKVDCFVCLLLLLHLAAMPHMLIVDFDVVFVFLDNQPHMLIVVFVFLLLHRCLLFISPLFFHQQYDATFLTNGATFWSDCLCRHLMQSLTFSRCLLFSHCFLLIFIFYDQQCHNIMPLTRVLTMWCNKQRRHCNKGERGDGLS